MSFKKMVEADNKHVFLNTEEFASKHTVLYDGNEYSDISILLIKVKEQDRATASSDNAQGIYKVSAVAYIDSYDTNGIVPEKDQRINKLAIFMAKLLKKPLD